MKLKKVRIKNFRRLTDVEFSLNQNIGVIVGPNAVGKSSIFEAIRLAKAVLFARMQDELRNVLISLGATSAHFFQNNFQIDTTALTGDPSQPLRVTLFISFSDEEIASLQESKSSLARNLSSILLGRSQDDPQFDLRAYFSTEQGKSSLENSMKEIERSLDSLVAEKSIEFFVEFANQQIQTSAPVNNIFVGFLEQRLSPDKAILSYFPADRSMPAGEVQIQIGPQDFKAQADSHLAHAGNKYGRLKQTIVNQAIVAGLQNRNIKEEFDSIFETLLPGKEFIGLNQKPTGLMTVLVKDIVSGRVFDIDSLSSGEKGLILSFLLFKTASVSGSIILVDEPELHLNPAVCKKIIPYLAQTILKDTDCQFLISTHSVEILRDAYETPEAELFHLRNDKDVSPVLMQDTASVREAIERLGVNAAQALTAKGTLFVEGDTDVALLEAAFPEILAGVLVQPLHGRAEVEKSIRELQIEEQKGSLKDKQAFLYDKDRKPSDLQSTKLVRVEQLQKYCIENYLLDETTLYDLIVQNSGNPPESRGAFSKDIKQIALEQLDGVILDGLLSRYRNLRVGVKKDEIKRKSLEEVADIQLEKLRDINQEISEFLAQKTWKQSFLIEFQQKKTDESLLWENDWKILCSGKVLFEGLRNKYQINVEINRFKVLVIQKLAQLERDDIVALKGMLNKLLES